MYYVFCVTTSKVVLGPFNFARIAADAVIAMPQPEEYCTMSRYKLAKEGFYPQSKSGNNALATDLKKVAPVAEVTAAEEALAEARERLEEK
jgi:hypothetical protein